jgi:hypothetical protein
MTYDISLTNGNLLTNIGDGTIDTRSTDLTLIGRNYTGFGQYFNENLVKLLENFAGLNAPTNPLKGQLWFNSATNNIEVYTITGWRSASGPVVSDTQPLNLTTGDFWIDSRQDQLYFYDGTNLILAGPIWGKTQGITGFKSETIFDVNGNPKIVLIQYVANQIFSILSTDEFTPSPTIAGFTIIKKGLQTSSLFSTPFHTTVSNSLKLNNLTSDQYMKLDIDQISTGALFLKNNGGITVGARSIGVLYVPETTTQVSLKNNSNGGILTLQTTDNNSDTNNALYIDGANNRMGIFNTFPTQELDVSGTTKTDDLIIANSLTITDGIAIEGSSISSSSDIEISPDGDILLLNEPKIVGLADPLNNNDAANKIYVDTTVKSSMLSLTFVDNGLEAEINDNIVLMLNDIADPLEFVAGKLAYVHVQHIDFIDRTIVRSLKKFRITDNVWEFVADLTSSI